MDFKSEVFRMFFFNIMADPGAWKLPNKPSFLLFESAFIPSFVCFRTPSLTVYRIFQVKVKHFLALKSDQDPDPDPQHCKEGL